jgi:hypothetical protein
MSGVWYMSHRIALELELFITPMRFGAPGRRKAWAQTVDSRLQIGRCQ